MRAAENALFLSELTFKLVCGSVGLILREFHVFAIHFSPNGKMTQAAFANAFQDVFSA